MKNTMRILMLGAAVLVIAATFQPAQAACTTAVIYSSAGASNGFTQFSSVQTAPLAGTGTGVQGSDVSANLRGNFWIIGNGDPDDAPSPGHDDGSPTQHPAMEPPGVVDRCAGATGWVVNGATCPIPYNAAYINATWAQDPRADGCPDLVTAQPTCQAILLTDNINDQSYFAALSRQELSDGNYDFSLPGGAPIILQPIPTPVITNSVRVGNDVQITLAPPSPAAGLYYDAACPPVLNAYKVYQRIVPRGTPVGPGRDPATWVLVSSRIPLGNGTTIQVDCSEVGPGQDVYLSHLFNGDSGFDLRYVGKESTRVECGPQLANPQEPGRQTRPGDRLPPRRR